eukprot:CAMPEP_0201476516 /NCGR_PEP_ID=MMETSP0151_2-20130828/1706_1 /ASSEMBLY_ACC=CAM_ASM_000257 /TAXON_ID=200890 /ORGANISM="Paramoeba atlantica, Strain 621/1 / CCAP 1560/9" /LENGTH=729 /DNA_ID=CAMNT_0047856911 /DNA_START=110 /DNA_END=2296 /DNA_ORIENTATION=+
MEHLKEGWRKIEPWVPRSLSSPDSLSTGDPNCPSSSSKGWPYSWPVAIVSLMVVWGIAKRYSRRMSPGTILEIDFSSQQFYEDSSGTDGFAAKLSKSMGGLTVSQLTEGIRQAAHDPNIAGLVCKIGSVGELSLSEIQELREAIRYFRRVNTSPDSTKDCESKDTEPLLPTSSSPSSPSPSPPRPSKEQGNKFCIAWAESFGEFRPGNACYYLASAFPRIYVQPTGEINLTGFLLDSAFIKGLFDKIGCEPQLDKRHEYKNAVNTYTETSLTEPHREVMTSLCDSLYQQMIDDIAQDRGLEVEEVKRLFDQGMLSASEAKAAGLVDALLYRDKVYEKARELADAQKGKPAGFFGRFFSSGSRTPDSSKKEANKEAKGSKSEEKEEEKEEEEEKLNQEIFKKEEKIQETLRKKYPLLFFSQYIERNVSGVDGGYHAMQAHLPSKAQSLWFFQRFFRYLRRVVATQRKVAIIKANGIILSGSSQGGLGGNTIGSDTMCLCLRKARRDPSVHAVVLKINSPGGSALASDCIRREIELLKKAGKYVVISMGTLAASGGYFIAMEADKIVASGATLTGSIGVFAGKLITRGMWQKIGITFDGIQSNEHSTFYSALHGYSENEKERLSTFLDRIYDDFVGKAASGRKMTVEEMDRVARGRVWTGGDALARGLVDELGGLDVAVRLAVEGLKPKEGEKISIISYPPPLSTGEMLSMLMKGPQNSDSVNSSVPGVVW